VLAKNLLDLDLNSIFRKRRTRRGTGTLARCKKHLQTYQVLPGIQQAVTVINANALN